MHVYIRNNSVIPASYYTSIGGSVGSPTKETPNVGFFCAIINTVLIPLMLCMAYEILLYTGLEMVLLVSMMFISPMLIKRILKKCTYKFIHIWCQICEGPTRVMSY